jgi:hypothetical protein
VVAAVFLAVKLVLALLVNANALLIVVQNAK